MKKQIHSDEAILAVCRNLVANEGVRRVVREDVRAALRERAEELGERPIAVQNGVIGPLLDRARAERREERVAAAQATAAAVEIDLPVGLGDLLEGHAHAVEELWRKALADCLQRGRAEADARIAHVQAEAQGERAVLEAELAAARSDRDSVALELDTATGALSA